MYYKEKESSHAEPVTMTTHVYVFFLFFQIIGIWHMSEALACPGKSYGL